jgi:hypothetical protein
MLRTLGHCSELEAPVRAWVQCWGAWPGVTVRRESGMSFTVTRARATRNTQARGVRTLKPGPPA